MEQKDITGHSLKVDVRKPFEDMRTQIRAAEEDSNCTVLSSKEAIAAIHRAKTESCKKEIFSVACKNEQRRLYASSLQGLCYAKGLICFSVIFLNICRSLNLAAQHLYWHLLFPLLLLVK